jgi:hypothetical protein
LRRYREEVIRKRKAAEDIEAQLAALEAQLRGEYREENAAESSIRTAAQAGQQVQEMAAD